MLSLVSVPSRSGKLPLIRPLSPDKVLREQPPLKPVATSAVLPFDCSEIRVSLAEAPVILSQPRTGKADYYELTWKPRNDGGAPVLEYVVKYRKVQHSSVHSYSVICFILLNSVFVMWFIVCTFLSHRLENLPESGPLTLCQAPSTSLHWPNCSLPVSMKWRWPLRTALDLGSLRWWLLEQANVCSHMISSRLHFWINIWKCFSFLFKSLNKLASLILFFIYFNDQYFLHIAWQITK